MTAHLTADPGLVAPVLLIPVLPVPVLLVPVLLVPALLALALLSALVVRRMIRHGVMDIPGERSSHDRPTPKGGGVGIAASWSVGLATAWSAGLVPGQSLHAACLLAAGLLIAAVSWADDIGQFGFRAKLAAQIGAGLLLVAGGLTIDRIGPVPLGPLAAPFTLAWLVLATNAVNFIDGLDGLASGCAAIAALTVALTSLAGGDPLPACSLLPLSAGIAGFLPFNFPRARIFMGDVGSQLCGLVLAAAAASASRLPGRPWGALLVPLCLLPVLFDVLFTLARRWHAGDRLTEAHRGHLYQLARRIGIPAASVTAIAWALTALSSACATQALRGDAQAGLFTVTAIVPVATAAALTLRAARHASIGRW